MAMHSHPSGDTAKQMAKQIASGIQTGRQALNLLNFIAYKILVGYNRRSITSRVFQNTFAHNQTITEVSHADKTDQRGKSI
jgi:hypothetical protein